MGKTRFALTVYIAPPGTDESDVGHMWISLDDNQIGLKEPYGFHPKIDGSAWPETGRVRTDDLRRYTIILDEKSFPITEETYHRVRDYCQMTISGNTFGRYLAIGNACINYAWDIMHAAGIENENFLGAVGVPVWPAWNVQNLDSVHDFYMKKWNGENPKTVAELLEGFPDY